MGRAINKFKTSRDSAAMKPLSGVKSTELRTLSHPSTCYLSELGRIDDSSSPVGCLRTRDASNHRKLLTATAHIIGGVKLFQGVLIARFAVGRL